MITKIDRSYIRNLVKEGLRVDGRRFDETRNLVVEVNTVKSAEGSATVKLGDTEVIVGVKMELGEPFPDTPDEGVMIVNAELGPIASPEFETGRPGEEAVELARVVDRGIRESKAIDFGKLCIEEGEKVWMCAIDIQVINHDGNLIDASGIGAIAALLTTRIPEYKDGEINREKLVNKLPISRIPVPCTVAKIGEKLVIDPNLEEEESMDARLTITSFDGKLCAMQKGVSGSFTTDEVKRAIEMALKNIEERKKVIEEITKT